MKTHRVKTWTAIFCAVLSVICFVNAEGLLTVKAPLERQVYQRNQQNQAQVSISGVINGKAEIIEAKADLIAGADKGKSVGWMVIAKDSQIDKGRFAGSMTLDAGGWYVFSVRALRGKEVVGDSRISKVGVGDVFITAGQSNSANYGKPRQAAKDDRVVYYNGKDFVPAHDPIPGGCGGGGSVWPILGDNLVKSQQIPVCFRSASLTWTQVKNWMPGVKYRKWQLYDNLVKCVGEFGRDGVRAVLWHQGESDSLAKTPAATYCERLKSIIDALNKDAGYDIPWFVAQASFHPGTKEPEEKEVAKGQQLLWEKGIAHKGAVTDDLGNEYRCDGVHFNQLGLTTHAERWFQALSDCETKADSDVATEPKPSSSAKSLKEMQDDFLKLKFGMFIHYNMATYKNTQWVAGYPDPSTFNPGGKVDTDAWADAAKAAGMKYAVLTAKHVGGFCLWDSKYTTYDIMHPDCSYKQDLVDQFVKSFTSRGLKVGLYYCWRHPGFDAGKNSGKYKVLPPECDPATHSLEEQIEFQKKQVAELVEKYPQIFYIWNDALDPGIMSSEDAKKFVRGLGPNIIANGNWWDWKKKGSPYLDIVVSETRHLGKRHLEKKSTGETCWCLERKWFCSGDANKSAPDLVKHMNTANGNNANFLLNVGPDKNGKIAESSLKILAEIGQLLSADGATNKNK